MSDHPAPPRRRGQQGFTLLEIMVVVIIIAILVTFAGLSLENRAQDDRLANEAQRLQQLLELAAAEAVMRGEELGLRVASDGYRFYRLEQDRWTPYTEGPLRERRLPGDQQLFLSTDDSSELQLATAPARQAGKKKDEEPPQILFLSSGELTPFVLELRARQLPAYYRSEGKITGSIVMRRIAAQAS